MDTARTKALLDDAYERYAVPGFVEQDPIVVAKEFNDPQDAEIIGFLTATIAWGLRKTIITNAREIARLMDHEPYEFVMGATEKDMDRLGTFVHRTFNGTDLRQFVLGLRHVQEEYGGIEQAFLDKGELGTMAQAITRFKYRFFELQQEARTWKHVADPSKGSNAKRINMYLRWMVRPNDRGVDLGLWKRITPAMLMVPLDVHTGRVARELGLLTRQQDDWKSVEELTAALRAFDANDPVKYDIALFGIGVNAG